MLEFRCQFSGPLILLCYVECVQRPQTQRRHGCQMMLDLEIMERPLPVQMLQDYLYRFRLPTVHHPMGIPSVQSPITHLAPEMRKVHLDFFATPAHDCAEHVEDIS
jgi:hypothetical protein